VVGVIGTINYRYIGKVFDNPVTTPESLDLQKILSQMLENGVTHVVMEVSSHGIDLSRVLGCYFDMGVFTNLTQDHLDYHGDMANYWECKKKLFTDILCKGPKNETAVAVVNCDDPKGKELLEALSIQSITIGRSQENMVQPGSVSFDLTGIFGDIITTAGSFAVHSSLVGAYNLENILCATGVGCAMKIDLEKIKEGIESVCHIPGRLEPVANQMERYVFVDYAHTPDALKNVLDSLKRVNSRLKNRLICVFGCGGDRDQEKRPIMGEIAGTMCDLSIITSDNPRTEKPGGIIDQIIEGIKRLQIRHYQADEVKNGYKDRGFVIEPDRKKAIRFGIMKSNKGDTILIAGKGHETYQIIGKKTVEFDDREEAKRVFLSMEKE
jgi:UDP-N-acetylmuramyl-tripeptide synthetase